MTVFKTSLNKVLKSTALVLIASTLMACQGETSANNETPAVTNVVEEKVVAQAAVTQVSESTPVQSKEIKSTPRPPADFSNLDSSTYSSVASPIAVSSGEQIEVTELFWFGCGHCYNLEPHLKAWARNKPANAKFKKVPALFSRNWEFHGKAFYTMEALNVPQEAYDGFFERIHVQRQRMITLDSLVNFLAPYGKDRSTVESTFNSFAVDSQMRNALKITKASGARGVPAMIIDGKYLTSQSTAGGTKQMFDVVDKLVAKAASER